MKILLSPAKTIDMQSDVPPVEGSVPVFLNDAERVAAAMKKLKPAAIAKLMDVNPEIAALTADRFLKWGKDDEPTRAAAFMFNGEVYRGLDAGSLSAEDLVFAQQHLLILSGLYGALRPLDMVHPYRLEMGTRHKVGAAANLYDFWQPKLTPWLAGELKNGGFVLNLASAEYAKAVRLKELGAMVITPQFREARNGKFVTLMTYAKHARGTMARWAIQHRITGPEDVWKFSEDRYRIHPELSTDLEPVFVR
jgi:hypothetical protein